MKLEEFITCPHTLRVLRGNGVTDMETLARYDREALLRLRGIGPVIAGDLEQRIQAWNQLKGEVAK